MSWWRRELTGRARAAISVLSVAALVALWWLASGPLAWAPPLFLPPPQEVASTFVKMCVEPYIGSTLWAHVIASLRVVMSGWLLAGLVGLPLGIAMAWWRRLRWIVFPVFQLVRPVPPLAWIPLAIVWLGLGDAAKVLVIWFAAFVPSVINSYTGVRSIEPHLVEAARSLGIRGPMLVREVLFPGALPLVFTGLRLSLQACWTTLVAGELIGAIVGLGHVLYQAGLDLFPAMIVVGMGSVAVAGAIMTIALAWIERVAIPWRLR